MGSYRLLERVDSKRVMMRVRPGEPLPPLDEEVMLDELEQWKWRVENSAAGAALLVTYSQCPHGLGLLPAAIGWQGGGHWRLWPGTFESTTGAIWPSTDGSPEKSYTVQSGEFTFTEAKRWCAETAGCAGFSYSGAWPDKEREGGVPRAVYFQSQEPRRSGAGMESVPVTVEIGGSSDNRKCVNVEKPVTCSPTAGNRGQRLNKDNFPDQFSIELQGEMVCARRVDRSEGWQMKLQIQCRSVSASSRSESPGGKGLKWSSYIRKDNPRAHCNPEGGAFECPGNPYACLGLSIDADDGAVKQAYRALSKKMHPDKIKAEQRTAHAVKQAETQFRDIANAYEILSDRKERQKADMRLRKQKQQWEHERASVQDIYIKEPRVASLEPESYPVLIPEGQEWLIHFFLPQNDDCKQMKMAMLRAVGELGIGEEERGVVEPPKPPPKSQLDPKDVFRGVMRPKALGLRTVGAGPQEGDLYLTLVVMSPARGQLVASGEVEEVELLASRSAGSDGRPEFRVTIKTGSQIFSGKFDPDLRWLRGTIADPSRPDKDIASFALERDTEVDAMQAVPPDMDAAARAGHRVRPRLFGAVNCGRFAQFCKRKGVDPAISRRFPQVRMLFPGENRFEIYRGRPLARDLLPFAREASRARGEVHEITEASLEQHQAGAASAWVVMLHYDVSAKVALDCQLCKSALPTLRRSALRLAEAGVKAGWVNCTASATLCGSVSGGEVVADWGAFYLAVLGHSAGTAHQLGGATTSSLLDANLLVGELAQQGLVAALEGAIRMAQTLRVLQVLPPGPAGIAAAGQGKGQEL